MAHPLYIAENAVKSFIDHWLIGLQPSLRLTTRFDGSIVVESDVISAPVLLPQKPVYDHFYRRHKSGNLARQRRKIIRTLNPPSPSKQKQDSLSICPSKLSTVDTAVQAVKVLVDVACETTQPVPVPPRKILSVENVSQTDIPPRKIYHPSIINASKAFYDKHPSDLSREEREKFKFYLQHKRSCGEPVETDVVYLPTSMRSCLHCGHPT